MTVTVTLKRQPFAARVWGSNYRTWWPFDSIRSRKKAKRRSAHRERQRAKLEIKADESQ